MREKGCRSRRLAGEQLAGEDLRHLLAEQELNFFPDGLRDRVGPVLLLHAPEGFHLLVDGERPFAEHKGEHDAEPRLEPPFVDPRLDGTLLQRAAVVGMKERAGAADHPGLHRHPAREVPVLLGAAEPEGRVGGLGAHVGEEEVPVREDDLPLPRVRPDSEPAAAVPALVGPATLRELRVKYKRIDSHPFLCGDRAQKLYRLSGSAQHFFAAVPFFARHDPRFRRTVTVSPPIPQLSVSTSSMTTTVVAGFFPRTLWSR